MSESDLQSSSETNWARVDQLTDDDINTSDVPPLDDSFFASADLRLPKGKVPVMMSVDADVFEWFKAQGPEYQALINVALRRYADSQKSRR